jgi:hypothetical protein
MKEKLFKPFLFVMGGLVYWFRNYSNDRSLRMLDQEARMARRGIWSPESPAPSARVAHTKTQGMANGS